MNRNCLIIAIIILSLSPLYAIAFPLSPAGGNALDLSWKQGYYYTEDINNSFDGDFLKNGMTIEFWFCPARVTNVGEGWNLIAKRPFYGIELAYFGERSGQKYMHIRY